eukprot:m51a1_g8775 hypothetical protein (456) ;mRNA; r:175978-177670
MSAPLCTPLHAASHAAAADSVQEAGALARDVEGTEAEVRRLTALLAAREREARAAAEAQATESVKDAFAAAFARHLSQRASVLREAASRLTKMAETICCTEGGAHCSADPQRLPCCPAALAALSEAAQRQAAESSAPAAAPAPAAPSPASPLAAVVDACLAASAVARSLRPDAAQRQQRTPAGTRAALEVLRARLAQARARRDALAAARVPQLESLRAAVAAAAQRRSEAFARLADLERLAADEAARARALQSKARALADAVCASARGAAESAREASTAALESSAALGRIPWGPWLRLADPTQRDAWLAGRVLAQLPADVGAVPRSPLGALVEAALELRRRKAAAHECVAAVVEAGDRRAALARRSAALTAGAASCDEAAVSQWLPSLEAAQAACDDAAVLSQEAREAAREWWEQPAQFALPWETLGGLNMQQWVSRWRCCDGIAAAALEAPAPQ